MLFSYPFTRRLLILLIPGFIGKRAIQLIYLIQEVGFHLILLFVPKKAISAKIIFIQLLIFPKFSNEKSRFSIRL